MRESLLRIAFASLSPEKSAFNYMNGPAQKTENR